MIAIAVSDVTYNVEDYNIHFNESTHYWELWVTRNNGKSALVSSSYKEADIREKKDMIDTAVEAGEYLVRL